MCQGGGHVVSLPPVAPLSANRPGPRPVWASWACPTCTGPADRTESIATIHAALDAGVTPLDTGDWYGMGDNELLLREALSTRGGTTP